MTSDRHVGGRHTVWTGWRRASVGSLALLCLLALVCSVALLPRATRAHSELLSSTPTDGSAIPTSPEEIRLRFTAEIDPQASRIELLTADGAAVATSAAGPDLNDPDRVMLVAVPAAALEAGDYVVRWTVIQANEPERHELTGEITFTVDPNAPPPPTPTTPSATAPTTTPPPTVTNVEDDDEGNGALRLVGGGVLLLAVLGGVGFLLLRRRGA